MQTPRARGMLCSKQATDRAGLADREGSILAKSSRSICSRCRNCSTHFDWRKLAASSSAFSRGISASGVFRASSTELERKTDPDDEGIVVPSQAASGFPRCGAPRGANPISSSGVGVPIFIPRWPSSPGLPRRIPCDLSHWCSQQLPQREVAPGTSSTCASLSSGVARESDARSYLAQRHVLTRQIPCAEHVTQRSQ